MGTSKTTSNVMLNICSNVKRNDGCSREISWGFNWDGDVPLHSLGWLCAAVL